MHAILIIATIIRRMTINTGLVARRVPKDEDDSTTIRISVRNWQRLNSLKLPGEDFDDAVDKALDAHDCVEDLEAKVEQLEAELERIRDTEQEPE